MSNTEKDSDAGSEANKENTQQSSAWQGPRTVVIQRADNSFGFTLRHFIVYPPESAMQIEDEDGADSEKDGVSPKPSSLEPMDTIFVKHVKDGGPAQSAGLQRGDRVVSVNGETVTGKTYSQVIALIQASDSSLKLLVVPRDEDILQMAYQSSAYNQGQEPYRGHASEIPHPPSIQAGSPMKSDAPMLGKPPLGPRFKSELQVTPEDSRLSDTQPGDPRSSSSSRQRTSISSAGSVSSGGSSMGGVRDHGVVPSQRERLASPVDSRSAAAAAAASQASQHSSSRNITLSSVQRLDQRSGSLDSISRSSDSSESRASDCRSQRKYSNPVNPSQGVGRTQDSARLSHDQLQPHHGSQERLLRRSNENLPNVRRSRENLRHSDEKALQPSSNTQSGSAAQGGRSMGRLPSAASPNPQCPQPYARSHTTSVLPSDDYANNYRSRSHGDADSERERPLSEGGFVGSQAHGGQPRRGSDHVDRSSYGLAVSYRHDRNGSGTPPDGSAPSHTYPSASRHSMPDRPMINLVTERMRRFESADSFDSNDGNDSGDGSYPNQRHRSEHSHVPHKFGYDSVVSRMQDYEAKLSEDSGDESSRKRKLPYEVSHSTEDMSWIRQHQQHQQRAMSTGSASTLPQARPPMEMQNLPMSPPATIAFYFRHDQGDTPPPVRVEPSPERILALPSSDYSGHRPDRQSMELRALVQQQQDEEGEEDGEISPGGRLHKPAVRQPSYLQAISSPDNRSRRPYHPLHTSSPSNSKMARTCQGAPPQYLGASPLLKQSVPGMVVHTLTDPVGRDPLPPRSSVVSAATTTSMTTTTVTLRGHCSGNHDESREAKLARRTSYLMATGRQNSAAPAADPNAQSLQLPAPASPQPPGRRKYQPRFELSLSRTKEVPEDSAGPPEAQQQQQQEQDPHHQHTLAPPTSSPQPETVTTPTKSSNIQKLKSFFGEKTPRIMEATSDRKCLFDMPSPMSSVTLEGTLNCKIAITDGKRASDRSWRFMWAVLRGQCLFLYKDKSNVSPTLIEEQPIAIRSSIVDIAYDYTKKKNVFRLTTYNGSEYLFQTDDHESMLRWIRAVQANSTPDPADPEAQPVELVEPTIRKTSQMFEQQICPQKSPQVPQKSAKKVSKTSLRSKSPSAHSPGPKPKKQLSEHTDSPKTKDTKTWKGRMAKKFKRYGSSSSTSVEVSESSESTEITGTFGVPLELCPPSTVNEYVPFVVELCTSIVEENGLENQGIYRVPGNRSAVNMLQEELNKGPDVDMDNEKWMEVNVVTSLLKSFFSKLPEPLVTTDLYDDLISANRIEDPEKRMLKVKKRLHDLPEHHFETFRYLAEHLSKVAEKNEMNKMDARNLAIVFGPTLVRKSDDSMITMVKDMSDQCRIVESVILHYQWFFSSWDEDIHVPADEPMSEYGAISGMNQQLLCKAENLALGDRGRDVSAKDLVSSIISAANKKIRKKDKYKSSDSVDVDADSEMSYNERNIDREVELRRIKEAMPQPPVLQKEESSSSLEVSLASSASTSFTSAATSTSTTTVSDAKAGNGDKPSDRMFSAKMVFMQRKDSETSLPPILSSDEARKLEVTRYPAYQPPELTSYATENAKPTMLRRFSEDFLTDRDRKAGHDEVNHQPHGRSAQFSRRAQFQLDALQKEKQELQRKEEERKVEQQRHLLARKRIEIELQKTREELEKDETVEDILSKGGRYEDVNSSKADTRSVTSDYSTMSSTGGFMGAPPVHISRSSSSLLTHTAEEVARKRADPRRRRLMRGTARHPAHDDMELYVHAAGPRPAAFEVNKVATRGGMSRTRKEESDEGWQDYEQEVHLRSTPRQRRNSLDSLRDFYHHGEYNSDTDDMVGSLTSTFDKKMRFLSDTPGPKSWEQAKLHGSLAEEGQYRDPSLHRSNQRDPEVGVASRFERRLDGKSISKSEKTDANLTKQRFHESSAAEYADAVRRSTERLYGSRERLTELSLPKQSADQSGAPATKHKDSSGRRCKRRRHTVGGTNDLEHFKALIEAVQNCRDAQREKVSAWERLQPAVLPRESYHLRQTDSSPALLDPTLQLLPPSERDVPHRVLTASASSPLTRNTVGSPASSSPPSDPANSPSPQFNAPIRGRAHTFTFESSI